MVAPSTAIGRRLAEAEAIAAVLRSKAEPLDAVAVAVAKRRIAETELLDAVYEARREEATWSELGEALGMTRQGAWEVYRDRLKRELERRLS